MRVLACVDLALTDARWARVAPLLPPQKRPTGRPANDHRVVLSGMLRVARTGASWREVPACFGPWPTVHSRYRIWRRDGIWQRVLDALARDSDARSP